MAAPLRIGLDFDGTIVDHSQHKCRIAEAMGFVLEPWQANSNVMKHHVPPDVYSEIKEMTYTTLTPKAPPVADALETIMTLPGELYIISARRPASVRHAQDWMIKYRLYDVIPAERIFFCNSGAEKRGYCERLGIRVYLDDKVDVLNGLPPSTKRVLFDPHKLSPKLECGHGTYVVDSWKRFSEFVRAA